MVFALKRNGPSVSSAIDTIRVALRVPATGIWEPSVYPFVGPRKTKGCVLVVGIKKRITLDPLQHGETDLRAGWRGIEGGSGFGAGVSPGPAPFPSPQGPICFIPAIPRSDPFHDPS